MANEFSADKPNVGPSRSKPFRRSRLYLQLVTIFAVALAFCLGISIFFKVETITVSGAERYSAWTVAEASGIQTGDSLLFFGRAGAMTKIKQTLPYVKNIRIGITLPGTVNIMIEEVPAVYSIKASDGNWWLMTASGKLIEQTNGITAGECTAIDGVLLDSPVAGQQAAAWEQPQDTDPEGQPVQLAARNADRLAAALTIAQQLERNEILGEAASIHVASLQDIRLWYGSRYEVKLGDSTELDLKIAAMKSAIAQMGEFENGVLKIWFSDGKWQATLTKG